MLGDRDEEKRCQVRVTTSWDDGHPLDLRLADLLERYELKATFYVPRRCRHKTLQIPELRELSKRFEVGAHTMDHIRLDSVCDEEAEKQLKDSRSWIQDTTGKECTIFCFPGGKYRRGQLSLVRKIGFSAARTVELLSLQEPKAIEGLMVIPTTVQVYPHRWTNYGRNALRRQALRNLLAARVCLFSNDWLPLARLLFQKCMDRGGVFHLWGHSWEIEEAKQWGKLEEFFAFASAWKTHTRAATNSELCANGRLL